MALTQRSALLRLAAALSLAASLGACASGSAYEDMMQAQPTGSPFAHALFQNYSALARSFGLASSPSTTAFDASGSLSISNLDSAVADVANAYAEKALTAAKGEEPLPEPAPTDDQAAEHLRLTLLRALDQGRTRAPAAAARAQADYDCWVLNGTVDSLAAAAAQCRRALNADLARLGAGGQHSSTPAAHKAAAATADFNTYFALNSAKLTPQAMEVLRRAIVTARAGRQTRITVVGHTDTSGSEHYNVALSKKRADVIRNTLVALGARREAIQVSGVGENGLAVETPDGVANAKNRRGVITLVP